MKKLTEKITQFIEISHRLVKCSLDLGIHAKYRKS